jgi:SAM-dependent methyltransferase
MRTDYGEVFRDARAVDKYEQVVYAPDSYSSIVSGRQRVYLRRLVRSSFPDRRPVQHDFACGTGRAVRLLHGMVREAHGYDTSPAMLEAARSAGLRARWHQVAADGPVPAPVPGDGPVLVTMLRLLLNVPEPVRERALAFAAQALPSPGSGLLVVENHGSAESVRRLRRRRRAGDPWFAELSHAQVTELLHRHGFTVVELRCFALLPAGAYRPRRTRPLIRRLDDLLCRPRFLSRYGVDVLYVAQRVPAAARPRRAGRG